MLLINRLTKITNDPIVQGANTVNVVGVGSHDDRLSYSVSFTALVALHIRIV
jgi:hypothetical protein